MRNQSRILLISLVILFASMIVVVFNQLQTHRLLNSSSFLRFEISQEFSANPNPSNSGPYQVCTKDYDFSPKSDEWWIGRIYIPVLDNQQCISIDDKEPTFLNRKFNLVIIAHADGEGGAADAHLNYQDIATHLASNAMIVVSLNRYPNQVEGLNAINIFDQVLTAHLEYLYNESAIRDVITDNIAIIGHSAGGRSVIRHGDAIAEFGKVLKSTILLAPTVDREESISFADHTESFLGIQLVNDSDLNAAGMPETGQPLETGFMIYDRLRLSSSVCREKDMLFVPQFNAVGPVIQDHYFQNEEFTRTYVNAYLQLHLNEHNIFERFFKFQERPSSFAGRRLWQQHDEWNRLALEDFEQLPILITSQGGSIDFTGISEQEDNITFINDPFSPHNTRALRFSTINQERATVTFNFSDPVDLTSFPYLSFRISQIYDPENNFNRGEIGFHVQLNSGQGPSEEVQIEDHGGLLHFPIRIMRLGQIGQSIDGTQNTMRSYLIRCTEFTEADLSQVEGVSFDFGVNNEIRQLVIDDVVFYGF